MRGAVACGRVDDAGAHHRAHAAFGDPVLDGHDDVVVGGVRDECRVGRLDDAGIPDGHADAALGEPVGRDRGFGEQLAHPDQTDPGAVVGAHEAAGEPGADVVLVGHDRRGARVADRHRSFRCFDRVVEHLLQLLVRRGHEHGHAGHLRHPREVEHAVVGGAVGAGHAGTVDREDHLLAVQAHVVDRLVEGPGEERRVQRHDGSKPGHRHTGRSGDGVLFGDADVDEPVTEPVGEGEEPGRAGHRRGDGDDLGVRFGLLDERLGERPGV